MAPSAATDPLDALAAQHGAGTGAVDPLDALAQQHGAQPSRPSMMDRAAALLPSVGGAIGSVVGGTLGAALGGAAGKGYETIYLNASQIGPALRDVGRNLVHEPVATLTGFAQGALRGAGEAGIQAGLQAGANVAGQAVVGAARWAAPALMQSALKPGIRSTLAAVKGGQIPPVVQTLLDEGANVTPGGLEKLNAIIGASNQTIRDTISSLPSTGSIQPLRVASRLNETARQFANQVNPQADLEAISQVGQNFIEAHGATDLSAATAQTLKTGTYKALKDKAYGELKGATIEAEKALARGLKEEIASEAANAGVDLAAVNAREGAAITARDAIAKRVAMVGNRDPAGLAWLAHSPVTFLMAVMERSPVVKSMLARGFYQSAEKASGVPAEAFRTAIAAIAAGGAKPPAVSTDAQGSAPNTPAPQ